MHFSRATSFVLFFSFIFSSCHGVITAEELTEARIRTLPAEEQPAWLAYWQTSQAMAKKDQTTLEAEVAAQGLSMAIKAPGGGDFKLSHKPDDPWYGTEEALALSKVILSYQAPNGGWSKHIGFSKGARRPGMQWTSQSDPGKPPHYQSTLDNRSTTEQMLCLACVWQATGNEDCANGFLSGLNYLLNAQYPNGGWPQVFPLEGGYHDDITLNDDAMTHVLELFHGIHRNEPQFAFVDATSRQKVVAAFQRGIECIIRMQVIHDGRRTGWCAQHDELTLRPSAARKMEPASLSGVESARMIKFLMTIPKPSPELVATIEGTLTWLDEVKITNVGKKDVNGKSIYVVDPKSTEVLWARFYDANSLKPVFPGRDGVVYESFEEMANNNELGYDYYSSLPGSVLKTGQKKWRKMLTTKE